MLSILGIVFLIGIITTSQLGSSPTWVGYQPQGKISNPVMADAATPDSITGDAMDLYVDGSLYLTQSGIIDS